LTSAIFVVAIISFALSSSQADALIIWLPAGLATWLFFKNGRRQLPYILGAQLLAFFFYQNLTGREISFQSQHFLTCLIALLLSPIGSLWAANFLGKLLNDEHLRSKDVRSRLQLAALGLIGFTTIAILPALVMQIGAGMPMPEALDAGIRNWSAQILGTAIFAPVILDQFLHHQSNLPTHKRKFIEYFGVYAIPVAIFGSSVFAWHVANTGFEENVRSQFGALVRENEEALISRINSYEDAVIGGAGLFYASDSVSRAEWRAYVSALRIEESFPGINGIGYIAKVAPDLVNEYVAAQRLDDAPEFAAHPAVDHDDYYLITYIEPVEINLAAVGLNIAFETNRKEAADLSGSSGQSAITGRILLVQDSEKAPGFLLLHPVYQTQQRNLSPAQRQEQLLGWVYAPFIGKNLLGGLTAAQGDLFNVQIYAGPAVDQEKLIYSSGQSEVLQNARARSFVTQRTLDVLQKNWTVVWQSTPQFRSNLSNYQPEFILASGALISCLLGLFLATLMNSAKSIRAEVERKTAEIADARNGLQAVLDTVVDGVIRISSDGIIVDFNPSAERIFGYSAKEVIGKNVDMLLPEPYHSRHDGYLSNYLSTGIEKIIGKGRVVSAKRKDGSVFPIELGVNKIVLKGQVGFVGSVRDITERVAAQNALEQGERNFRQTLENAPIAAIAISPEGALIRVNKAAKILLGYAQEDLADSNIELAHRDDNNIDAAQMQSLLESKEQNYTVEKRLVTKSGELIWVEQHVSLVRHADGSPKYFIKQMINLTERKKTERIKNEFIATVSHELRTPITSISGALGLILGAMNEELPEKVVDLLKIAHKNSQRLIALVNDILDMEKLGAGEVHYEFDDFNVRQLIEQTVSASGAYAQNHGVKLLVPEANEDFKIHTDELRFNQVLTNFISNACKFSPAGGTVTIEAQQVGDRGRISVCDNGVGIAEEFKTRIFSKFAQADSSTTRQKGGTGLGLMISKQLVEQMNGTIGFESEPNVETKFWFEFALAK